MSGLQQKLLLLYNNDLHSHLEEAARLDTMFREWKAEYASDQVMTLDIGDHMDRMRMETEGSFGKVNTAIINAMKYDAIVPGNNEGLTFPYDILATLYGQNLPGCAAICCNLYRKESGTIPEWLYPYKIFQRGSLKIGLIGVTAAFTQFYDLLGWEVRDPFAEVERWIGVVRPQVDILILMSHLGRKHDESMAEQLVGIDIILGGHTHHLIEKPIQIGSTWISATGKFGQYAGRMEITYDLAESRITYLEGQCIPTEEIPPSPAILEIIERYAESAEREMKQPVIELTRKLEISWDSESPLGNLLAQGIRHRTGAQIGIINAGQLLEDIGPGEVTKRKLHSICPSPINPCKVMLRGEQIIQALEESLLPEYQQKRIFGFGFRGKVLGSLCVDGITIDFEENGNPYSKIKQVRIEDSIMQADTYYSVGTLDMFSFGSGYLSLGQGDRYEYFLPQFLRDVLASELQDATSVEESRGTRWIPCRQIC